MVWIRLIYVCVLLFHVSSFFFFLLEVGFTWGIDLPVGTVHSARDLLAFWTSTHWSEMALFVGPMHCSRDPQTSFFTQTLITNGSHSTIHIFKNYFATIFSVFSKISCIQTDLKKGSNKRWIGAKNYIVSYWLHYWKYLFHLPSD